MAKRKWNFEYSHQGYISEDDENVSFKRKGEITEGDEIGYDGYKGPRVVKSTRDALILALERRNDGDTPSPEFLDEECEVEIVEGGVSTLVWSWSDCDGDGHTEITLTEVP
jgi:hypothetical protein